MNDGTCARNFVGEQDLEDNVLLEKIVRSCKYLRQVIQEAMRLHPVGFATMKITKEEVQLGDYVLPQGQQVCLVS